MTTAQDVVPTPQAAHNPLLDTEFLIPFDRIRPEHAEPAVDTLIDQARADLEALAQSDDQPGFLKRLDRLTERLDTAVTVVHHLEGVVSSDEWRAARRVIQPKVSAFYTDLGMHAGLYAALKRFAASDAAAALGTVEARFLKLSLDDFRRSGADLPSEEQARLKALNIELGEITSRYSSNSMDGVGAFELYVPAERLAGVPERIQQATARDAATHGQPGMHRLTLHAPTYIPILTYGEDRTLREELYRAFNAVGTGEGRDNTALLPDILRLRQEKAELLGYANYADYLLEDRMAKSGAGALAFERDLEKRTRPAFVRENAELESYYRQQVGQDAPALAPWDTSYWAEKQRLATYDFDDEALRPYFAIDSVLSGLFDIASRLFGIVVAPAEAPGWHPEVRFYTIQDETGTHLASFYTDWFPRDSKRGGAWHNKLKTGGPQPDGSFRPHLGLMAGNLTPPSADTPALLSHDEVETVFHEFGHLLHSSLSRVPLRSLSGTSVAWDFVELPSHFMENWTWNREALNLFGRHYQTGEPVPDELYQKMLRARNFRAANAAMRQYSFATVDLALHTEYTPESGDPLSYSREMMAPFLPVPALPDDARITNFGHLFSSPVGYAAGYYSYKWAEVLEADAFSRFEKEGIFNRQTGQAFVNSVLSRGNSAAPDALFEEFMGRAPDPDALLRRSGLL
ncbi:M3 family metallopeptidase [Deinococcus sp. KNUC1210]|uniref:M3 family metallopeptidase n=1 Tax=Deinococcus sp. KNUC1210 TaxID=2917691 RepID=UPI001EF07B91|nr:M3 family metallopeptidase [Deinococcus sp. KNUC1210]ULH16317.1 M3 family metallopeptidase [Deinococcus sp. KNUC1210]